MSEDTVMSDADKAKAADVEARMNTARGLNPKRRLYVVESPAGTIILGTPPRNLYQAYRALTVSDEPADKAKALESLLAACAVDPPATEYVKPGGILDDYPGLPGNPEVYSALAKASGLVRDDYAKK